MECPRDGGTEAQREAIHEGGSNWREEHGNGSCRHGKTGDRRVCNTGIEAAGVGDTTNGNSGEKEAGDGRMGIHSRVFTRQE